MHQNVYLLDILILRITLVGYRQQFQKLKSQITEPPPYIKVAKKRR